ncbi:DUF805 domain-containing protein [Nitratireductor sp. XY-223]|uniref:DUF805 domain-containing protein n=1 Tax=Nitratireductor sp. XY-223 TaxID=2561926 RepID=UPI0010AA9435|nr:DUF805 domain-containing protein [Nitratireductor sp. XY-223]
MTDTQPAQPGTPAPTMRWFFLGLSGRIGRLPYLLGILFLVAVSGLIVSRLASTPEESTAFAFWSLVSLVFGIASIWAMVALSVKRLHDMILPGALALCLFVPAISIVAVFVMCLWPGSAGPNRFGKNENRPAS